MDADEHVDGASVDWEGVGGAIVGSGAGVIAIGIAEYYALVTTGLVAVMSGVSTFLGNLVTRPFDAGLSAWESIWSSFEAEVVELGVWALPVTALAVSLVLIMTMWGVTRFAR